MKSEKYQIGRGHVKYLGHRIGQCTRRPLKAKVTAVHNFPKPKLKTDLPAFLGLTGKYNHYIRNYSQLAS